MSKEDKYASRNDIAEVRKEKVWCLLLSFLEVPSTGVWEIFTRTLPLLPIDIEYVLWPSYRGHLESFLNTNKPFSPKYIV